LNETKKKKHEKKMFERDQMFERRSCVLKRD